MNANREVRSPVVQDQQTLAMPANVRAGQVVGLVEVTGGLDSAIDIPRLADEFGSDIATFLPILDTAEMLGLVRNEKGDISLTDFGRKFQKTAKYKVALLKNTLAKLEPFWANYEDADLVAVPPAPADKTLPWNWKIHVENFTDAYHPEFVHRGTHDFAPSVHPDGGVVFTDMSATDNAIVRSVPLLRPDGGMIEEGWGEPAAFPPIPTLSAAQRSRLTFAMLPPNMTLTFTPGSVSYQLVTPVAVTETMASNDRVTMGGWLLPRSTL